jgi:hypothetical protein
MSGDLSAVEKSIEEILIDLMAAKFMFVGIEASSTGGLQSSPLTRRRFVPSQTVTEKRSKHPNDLVNAKKIPSVLPDYFPPLDGKVSNDSVPRDFEYTLITVYLLKGICIVGLQLGLTHL